MSIYLYRAGNEVAAPARWTIDDSTHMRFVWLRPSELRKLSKQGFLTVRDVVCQPEKVKELPQDLQTIAHMAVYSLTRGAIGFADSDPPSPPYRRVEDALLLGQALSSASEARHAQVHKALRLLLQFEERGLPWLSPLSIRDALDKIACKTSAQVREGMGKFLHELASPSQAGVKIPRGVLLWGPPGTGKTTTIESLANHVGMELIADAVSGGHLNAPKVGDTEKLIEMLCARAKRIPWALCCVAIDEIDSIAPDRRNKTSEWKVDTMSVLLSVFGGIQDVPNLFLFGSYVVFLLAACSSH